MARAMHDAHWCARHGVEIFEFQVPETGRRLGVPVVASSAAGSVLRAATATARAAEVTAAFSRHLVPYETEDGDYAWREA